MMSALAFILPHRLLSEGRAQNTRVSHTGSCWRFWDEFFAEVSSAIAYLKTQEEKAWILAEEETYDFAVGLFALLYAGKRVLIPHNTKLGTLQGVALEGAVRLDLQGMKDKYVKGIKAACLDPINPINPATAEIDLFTSGSTGAPKRISKTLLQLEAELLVLERLWGEKIGAHGSVSTVPHQHIYGLLFRVLWPLSAARPFDAVTSAHPDTLLERLSVFGSAVLVSSPAQLSRMPKLIDLNTLHPLAITIFSSGGALSEGSLADFLQSQAPVPIEIFGSTETGGVAWRQRGRDETTALWQPFPGLNITQDEAEKLVLESPFLGAQTKMVMEDRIALTPSGAFKLCGRADRVVKIEEKRLALPEMEGALNAHLHVRESALVVLSGARQSLGAVLVLTEAGGLAQKHSRRDFIAGLKKYLARYFEAVLLPRYWRVVEALPFTERGKLDTEALKALFEESHDNFFPTVSRVEEASGRVTLDLEIDVSMAHFKGHFPGFPIVPGVILVHWAIHYARQYFMIDGVFNRLENIKFLALVIPKAFITLTLEWHEAKGQLSFKYDNTLRQYANGRIVFKKEGGLDVNL